MPISSNAAVADGVQDAPIDYARALQAKFPELAGSDAAFEVRAEDDLTLVDWDGWQALFPRSEAAAERLRVMASVTPHLRGFVSPAIPIWEAAGEVDAAGDRRRAWLAAPALVGRPLHPQLIVDQNRERLVNDLARFVHELHGFSVERARSLGVAPFRAWREQHAALAQRSQAILRPLLSWSDRVWARRWWSALLDDEAVWQAQPALVHGGIDISRLLVDPLVQELAAVTGWQRLRIADPALDFAALIDAYGTDLGWRIVERYGELGSTADAALFRRVRLQQTVRRFRDVVEAADRDGVEGESMAAALKRLR